MKKWKPSMGTIVAVGVVVLSAMQKGRNDVVIPPGLEDQVVDLARRDCAQGGQL
jgi:hypothetical protein